MAEPFTLRMAGHELLGKAATDSMIEKHGAPWLAAVLMAHIEANDVQTETAKLLRDWANRRAGRMTTETIKDYVTSDIGASQSLVTLEGFIGDVENAETVDDGTFDCSDAVTAINGLIFSLEQRDAEIERLREIGLGLARAYEGYLPDPERVDTRGDVNTRLMFIADERKKLLGTAALEQLAEKP